MPASSYLVTGGAGFIGSVLVRRLVEAGHRVRAFDNESRGSQARLAGVRDDVEYVVGDVRDADAVAAAVAGVERVVHAAAVNGTEHFYSMPEVVLDVGVRGMLNVIDACLAHGVAELVFASSSEVYQTPPSIPTDESAPLVVPDPHNPRYSYGGAKIVSELLALNYGRRRFERVLIFRPHNVYGPDMGWEHVLPQFVVRMKRLAMGSTDPVVRFPIQGDGTETRSFVYIDDLIEGTLIMMDKGEHLGIYHIGNPEEVTMAAVARMVGRYFDRDIEVVPGSSPAGGAKRRCPDVSKLSALGYRPKTGLKEGLPLLARWYDAHAHLAPRD